ncbi:hypothetical protein ABIA32_001088 [Streptacidiphilus sp. MAP12-20]|uniref:hypothetical protein n=1 Tax=Streptacidiphilus sp. MAP12-20 TaxID=3156299 RepID=UPI003516D79C
MSLNRGVAALGAVAVVGAATLGVSIPLAIHYGKPVSNVSVVAGSHWTQIAPLPECWNKGDALSDKQQAKCLAAVSAAVQGNKLPTAIVPSAGGSFGINVDQAVIENNHSWQAKGLTGALVPTTKHAYAGPLSITTVLTTQDPQTGATSVGASGPVLVAEVDANKNIYGEWLFQLKVAN